MDITEPVHASTQADQPPPSPLREDRPRPRRSRAAVASLVLSLAALAVVIGVGITMGGGQQPDEVFAGVAGLAMIAALVGSVVTGIVAVRRIKRSNGALSGVGLASSGLTLSGLMVALTVVGAILESTGGAPTDRSSDVLLRENFNSGRPEFSLDSDRDVDLSVADGAYRIWIKDPVAPQFMRYVFAHTHPGLRFEATITTEAATGGWISSIGCWAGDSAYLFVVMDTGQVGMLETVSEATGERRPMAEEIRTDALRPEGQPNRLRIDCVGGGREPTVISGWVNGEPVVSVAVPEGFDSFSAVGFFVGANAAGTVFVADDVVVTADRPAPGVSPVPPIGEAPHEAGVTATTCEGGFADAKEAFDAGRGTDALDVISFGAPKLCSTLAEARAAAVEQLGRKGAKGLEIYLARSCAYTGPSVGIRDTDLCRELLALHPELTP